MCARTVSISPMVRFLTSEKPKLQDWAAKLIIEEQKTYRDLVREQPGFSMMQKRKLEEFIGWNKRQKLADSLLPWRVLTPKPSASQSTLPSDLSA